MRGVTRVAWVVMGLVVAAGGALPPRPDGRIINGWKVTEGPPWTVSLQVHFPYHGEVIITPFCGAAAIRPGWVLTAAHCLHGKDATLMREMLQVHIGGANSLEMSASFSVADFYLHADYDKDTKRNDIALIKLNLANATAMEGPFLPLGSSELPPGTLCNVTGFGKTSAKGPSRNYDLYSVAVPLATTEACTTFLKRCSLAPSEDVLCAGGGKGDACQGDSGGPLVYCPSGTLTDAECRLEGIVSWGSGCAIEGNLGVYTRVSRYVDWVDSTIADNS